ncbi:MAG: hypothetical protein EOM20_18485, partial [Spartobacteria bacterium]|nr:hypothetical protein [Spartobacteria bacterium]
MPIIEQGPLSGLYRPDYDGGSIVNLMASIINARGGHSPHAELACLPSDRIRPYRKVLYLVLDGLGINQLEAFKKQHPNSVFFGTREYQPISSVFPATTAAAVTTFARGASPAEHAILSWYLFLPDLGVISTILLQTSYLDQPLAPPDFPMAA